MDQTQQDFLKDLEPSNDQFGATPEEVVEEPKETEEEVEERKNRRERRLEQKLQAERESSIALAARLDALTEAQKFSKSVEQTEYEKAAERIYGNQTPEAVAATELLKSALKGVEERARTTALEQFREEQRLAQEAVKKEEATLNSMVEELEDEYGVTIDGNTSKQFFQLLEKLSPKDRDGNIKEYADHHAVWEELQSRRVKPENRAKELAARGATRSGAGTTENIQTSSQEKWLKEMGII